MTCRSQGCRTSKRVEYPRADGVVGVLSEYSLWAPWWPSWKIDVDQDHLYREPRQGLSCSLARSLNGVQDGQQVVPFAMSFGATLFAQGSEHLAGTGDEGLQRACARRRSGPAIAFGARPWPGGQHEEVETLGRGPPDSRMRRSAAGPASEVSSAVMRSSIVLPRDFDIFTTVPSSSGTSERSARDGGTDARAEAAVALVEALAMRCLLGGGGAGPGFHGDDVRLWQKRSRRLRISSQPVIARPSVTFQLGLHGRQVQSDSVTSESGSGASAD